MARGTIEEMRILAKSRGGKCVSLEYKNSQTKLIWRCNLGHSWESTPNNVKNGKWCPECGIKARSEKRKGSIQAMRQIAVEKGGKCLSEVYVDSKSKLSWRCAIGHEWDAIPSNIKRGKWCPKCAVKKNTDKKRKNITDMQLIAKRKGGKCLSEEFFNMNSIKLLWECHKGHQWFALPCNVFSGKWCPTCAGQNRTITEMQIAAAYRNGNCLSTVFIDMKTKLDWQCEKGHVWKASPNTIINKNSWCPFCNGNAKRTIEEMKILAKGRGGKCISPKYLNIDTPLLWKCIKGHVFKATPYTIEKGRWCSICSSNTLYFNEEKCRFILESLLQKKFFKTRKEIGNGLELDGYNSELKLAFEYNGMQHYSFIPYFHNNEYQFKEQKRRDNDKKRLCKENSIKLIVIPYHINSDGDKVDYILEELKVLNIEVINGLVEWEQFYRGFNPLDELQAIAAERRGKCLSFEYKGINEKLSWECEDGHVWETSPYYIKQGSWCPFCLGRGRTINDMREMAVKFGGECLSISYINNHTKLTWKCKDGHIWDAAPSSITKGSWCPTCAGRFVTILDMQLIAASKKGKCLSNRYENSTSKLLWECHNGHHWEAIPNSIKQGSWCLICNTKTILDMKKLAQKYSGKCVSEKYNGSSNKLKWKCSLNHIWKATPNDVQRGRWCPACKELRKDQTKRNKLDELNNIATRKEGKCLSSNYYDVDTKLKWECKYGHKWESTPYSVKNGSWCPRCAIQKVSSMKKNSIDFMKKLAEKNDGKCLSKNYINSQSKLLWECKESHRWESNPNNIQQGSWCPKCKQTEISKKQRKTIEDMVDLAKKRNGKCISTHYINAHTKLKWQCEFNHEWEAKPNNIQQGKWCPKCNKKRRNN